MYISRIKIIIAFIIAMLKQTKNIAAAIVTTTMIILLIMPIIATESFLLPPPSSFPLAAFHLPLLPLAIKQITSNSILPLSMSPLANINNNTILLLFEVATTAHTNISHNAAAMHKKNIVKKKEMPLQLKHSERKSKSGGRRWRLSNAFFYHLSTHSFLEDKNLSLVQN